MPSTPHQTSGRWVEQEGRIQLAISALQKNEVASIRRAAEIFHVPRSTLRGRLNGCQCRVEKRANHHRLSPTQEESRLATPHALRQSQKQVSLVKKLLKQRSQSTSTTSKLAIQQIIKGCEMIMQGAALLAKENHNLRAALEEERQKSKGSTRQISPDEGRFVQEARDLIQASNTQDGGSSIDSAPLPLEPPKRAPPRCSNCFIIGHTRVRCPTRRTS